MEGKPQTTKEKDADALTFVRTVIMFFVREMEHGEQTLPTNDLFVHLPVQILPDLVVVMERQSFTPAEVKGGCGYQPKEEGAQRFAPWMGDIEQWVQADHNALFKKPLWAELLPAEAPDSDAFEPFYFFPAREKAKGSDFQFAFSQAGKKQNGPDFQFAFSRAGKKQSGQDFQPSHFDYPTLHEQETAQSGQFAQTSYLLFPGPGNSKMVKTSNQATFILVCFWLGAALHEQEMAQSGQFAQTSREKAKWSRLSICFFPGWEKAKWSRLPTKPFSFWCVFGWAQPSMNKRWLSQASLLRLPICFFPGREKAKWFRLPICFFPGLEKAKGSDFQFAFSRPGKKQNGSDFQFAFSQPGKKQSEV